MKDLVLEYALCEGDMELFKKGCTVVFERDCRPTTEFFKWLGKFVAKPGKEGLFKEIQSR